MTLVQGCDCFYRECLFVALLDFSPLFESDDKLSDQPIGPPSSPGPNVLVVEPFIPKYTKENLQQIFKTVLKAQALTTSEKLQEKPLKARSLW